MRKAPANITTTPRATPKPTPKTHLSDPDLAAVLFAAWSGDPAVVVSSPPGAGKTTLITRLAEQLSTRAGLRVCIAAQTRAQAMDVAGRLATLGQDTRFLGGVASRRPAGLHPGVVHVPGAPRLRTASGIVVATTARWLWTETDMHGADVLLVDEAFQMTHADLAALGSLAPQMVLVGDPGQIDPVVTGSINRWRGQPAGPHTPAPIALLATHGPAITEHKLTKTWRCGPDTTALIQPIFYPMLPFVSARRPVAVLDQAGNPLPEITTTTINPSSENDPLIAATAAARVRALLSGAVHTNTTRPLQASDVAVVTPHVNQASLTAAHLADLPEVLIGTANSVQGSERNAVVVIHPLCGQAEVTPFNTDLGRACVALSRHRAHADILIDHRSLSVLDRALRESPEHATTSHHALLTDLLGR